MTRERPSRGPCLPERLTSVSAMYLILFIVILNVTCTYSAPLTTEIALQDSERVSGCYYMMQHYAEGERIITNEPCLNCTCHDSMLMCFLKVCPFAKPIGQDCIVEKRPEQCCPVITCPEVPVPLMIGVVSTTTRPVPASITGIAMSEEEGCLIEGKYYPDGAQVPSDPSKPCDLCYCIRNHTACVMQECTLHVDGCSPVFEDGVCCPVRYDCDRDKRPVLIGTTAPPAIANSDMCFRNGEVYTDGALVPTEDPCEHCYCMHGDIVCAVQECGRPMQPLGNNCVAIKPRPDQCCPEAYECSRNTSAGRKLNKKTLRSPRSNPLTANGSEETSVIVTDVTESSDRVDEVTPVAVAEASSSGGTAEQQAPVTENFESVSAGNVDSAVSGSEKPGPGPSNITENPEGGTDKTDASAEVDLVSSKPVDASESVDSQQPGVDAEPAAVRPEEPESTTDGPSPAEPESAGPTSGNAESEAGTVTDAPVEVELISSKPIDAPESSVSGVGSETPTGAADVRPEEPESATDGPSPAGLELAGPVSESAESETTESPETGIDRTDAPAEAEVVPNTPIDTSESLVSQQPGVDNETPAEPPAGKPEEPESATDGPSTAGLELAGPVSESAESETTESPETGIDRTDAPAEAEVVPNKPIEQPGVDNETPVEPATVRPEEPESGTDGPSTAGSGSAGPVSENAESETPETDADRTDTPVEVELVSTKPIDASGSLVSQQPEIDGEKSTEPELATDASFPAPPESATPDSASPLSENSESGVTKIPDSGSDRTETPAGINLASKPIDASESLPESATDGPSPSEPETDVDVSSKPVDASGSLISQQPEVDSELPVEPAAVNPEEPESVPDGSSPAAPETDIPSVDHGPSTDSVAIEEKPIVVVSNPETVSEAGQSETETTTDIFEQGVSENEESTGRPQGISIPVDNLAPDAADQGVKPQEGTEQTAEEENKNSEPATDKPVDIIFPVDVPASQAGQQTHEVDLPNTDEENKNGEAELSEATDKPIDTIFPVENVFPVGPTDVDPSAEEQNKGDKPEVTEGSGQEPEVIAGQEESGPSTDAAEQPQDLTGDVETTDTPQAQLPEVNPNPEPGTPETNPASPEDMPENNAAAGAQPEDIETSTDLPVATEVGIEGTDSPISVFSPSENQHESKPIDTVDTNTGSGLAPEKVDIGGDATDLPIVVVSATENPADEMNEILSVLPGENTGHPDTLVVAPESAKPDESTAAIDVVLSTEIPEIMEEVSTDASFPAVPAGETEIVFETGLTGESPDAEPEQPLPEVATATDLPESIAESSTDIPAPDAPASENQVDFQSGLIIPESLHPAPSTDLPEDSDLGSATEISVVTEFASGVDEINNSVVPDHISATDAPIADFFKPLAPQEETVQSTDTPSGADSLPSEEVGSVDSATEANGADEAPESVTEFNSLEEVQVVTSAKPEIVQIITDQAIPSGEVAGASAPTDEGFSVVTTRPVEATPAPEVEGSGDEDEEMVDKVDVEQPANSVVPPQPATASETSESPSPIGSAASSGAIAASEPSKPEVEGSGDENDEKVDVVASEKPVGPSEPASSSGSASPVEPEAEEGSGSGVSAGAETPVEVLSEDTLVIRPTPVQTEAPEQPAETENAVDTTDLPDANEMVIGLGVLPEDVNESEQSGQEVAGPSTYSPAAEVENGLDTETATDNPIAESANELTVPVSEEPSGISQVLPEAPANLNELDGPVPDTTDVPEEQTDNKEDLTEADKPQVVEQTTDKIELEQGEQEKIEETTDQVQTIEDSTDGVVAVVPSDSQFGSTDAESPVGVDELSWSPQTQQPKETTDLPSQPDNQDSLSTDLPQPESEGPVSTDAPSEPENELAPSTDALGAPAEPANPQEMLPEAATDKPAEIAINPEEQEAQNPAAPESATEIASQVESKPAGPVKPEDILPEVATDIPVEVAPVDPEQATEGLEIFTEQVTELVGEVAPVVEVSPVLPPIDSVAIPEPVPQSTDKTVSEQPEDATNQPQQGNTDAGAPLVQVIELQPAEPLVPVDQVTESSGEPEEEGSNPVRPVQTTERIDQSETSKPEEVVEPGSEGEDSFSQEPKPEEPESQTEAPTAVEDKPAVVPENTDRPDDSDIAEAVDITDAGEMSSEMTKRPQVEATVVEEEDGPATEGTSEETTNKSEVGEESAVPSDNEVALPTVVPGEGSCSIDGVVYAHGESVPSKSPCTYNCVCLGSTVTCAVPSCVAPPADAKCSPIITEDSCCPNYVCEGSCFIDGVVYPNFSPIPSNNPCLSCFCVNSVQECSTPVCSRPPNLGCPLVKERVPGDCCPTWRCQQPGENADFIPANQVVPEPAGSSTDGALPVPEDSQDKEGEPVPTDAVIFPGPPSVPAEPVDQQDNNQSADVKPVDAMEEVAPAGEVDQPATDAPNAEGVIVVEDVKPTASESENLVSANQVVPEPASQSTDNTITSPEETQEKEGEQVPSDAVVFPGPPSVPSEPVDREPEEQEKNEGAELKPVHAFEEGAPAGEVVPTATEAPDAEETVAVEEVNAVQGAKPVKPDAPAELENGVELTASTESVSEAAIPVDVEEVKPEESNISPAPEAPATDRPDASEQPATNTSNVTEAPATNAPAASGAPATDAPAASGAPATDAPTASEVPATDAPAASESSATDAVAASEKPATSAQAGTEAQATDAPAASEQPANNATEAPAAPGAPVTDAPAASEEPSTDAPVASEAPSTNAPVASGASVTDTSAGSGVLATDAPAESGSPGTEVSATSEQPATNAPVTDQPAAPVTDAPAASATDAIPSAATEASILVEGSVAPVTDAPAALATDALAVPEQAEEQSTATEQASKDSPAPEQGTDGAALAPEETISVESPATDAAAASEIPATNAQATDVPAASEQPANNATEAPAASGAPVTDEPAASEEPSTDAPVSSGASSTDAPVTSGASVTDTSAGSEAPATDAPAESGSPATDVLAASGAPATEVSSASEQPETNVPVTDAPAAPATGAPAAPVTDTPAAPAIDAIPSVATVAPVTDAPAALATDAPPVPEQAGEQLTAAEQPSVDSPAPEQGTDGAALAPEQTISVEPQPTPEEASQVKPSEPETVDKVDEEQMEIVEVVPDNKPAETDGAQQKPSAATEAPTPVQPAEQEASVNQPRPEEPAAPIDEVKPEESAPTAGETESAAVDVKPEGPAAPEGEAEVLPEEPTQAAAETGAVLAALKPQEPTEPQVETEVVQETDVAPTGSQPAQPEGEVQIVSEEPAGVTTPVAQENEPEITAPAEEIKPEEPAAPEKPTEEEAEIVPEAPSQGELGGSAGSTELKPEQESEQVVPEPEVIASIEPVPALPEEELPESVSEPGAAAPETPAEVASEAPSQGGEFTDYDVKPEQESEPGLPASMVPMEPAPLPDIVPGETPQGALVPEVAVRPESEITELALPEEEELPEIVIGPGACLFDGKVFVSAQQIPRDDPCDFCFCFRGDIICLQQSCPPPIPGCFEEVIGGFCCPRYECPVRQASQNITIQPTLPPLPLLLSDTRQVFLPPTQVEVQGCEILGEFFRQGSVIPAASGPCLECRCGMNGMMECDPRDCQPEPMLRKMMAAAVKRRRRSLGRRLGRVHHFELAGDRLVLQS